MWPWLGPPLMVLRYVIYFRFNGRRHVSHRKINASGYCLQLHRPGSRQVVIVADGEQTTI